MGSKTYGLLSLLQKEKNKPPQKSPKRKKKNQKTTKQKPTACCVGFVISFNKKDGYGRWASLHAIVKKKLENRKARRPPHLYAQSSPSIISPHLAKCSSKSPKLLAISASILALYKILFLNTITAGTWILMRQI